MNEGHYNIVKAQRFSTAVIFAKIRNIFVTSFLQMSYGELHFCDCGLNVNCIDLASHVL